MKNLQKIADAFFQENKDTDKVFITTDGFVFLKKNAADLHAQTGADGKKLSVRTFENTGAANTEPEKPKPSADERIEAIKQMTTVDAVKEALKGERASTVKEAGKVKIAELMSGQKIPEVRGDDVDPKGVVIEGDDTKTNENQNQEG